MVKEVERVESQLATLHALTGDLDLLDERDKLVSVGIENFNAYNEQYNSKLTAVTLHTYSDLEVGREGLKEVIKKIKHKIMSFIRKVLDSVSTMLNKFTSFTGMMKRSLQDLEDEVQGDVVFNRENMVDYNKLNEMCYLDGQSVEGSFMDGIENVRMNYNESIGILIKHIDTMVEHQLSYLDLIGRTSRGNVDLMVYDSVIKSIKEITNNRYTTPLKLLMEKKFKKSRPTFVHHVVFKTTKEVRLVLLDYKKCKKDKSKIKDKDGVCDKLKVTDAEAKIIINRDNPFDTIRADDLESLIKDAINSMSDYDPVDVEKSIKDNINNIHDRIAETKSTNKRTISNLSVLVRYYGLLMKYSTKYIYDQHKINYRGLKFLVHLSGD